MSIILSAAVVFAGCSVEYKTEMFSKEISNVPAEHSESEGE